jgi:tetratricopeptide (TPR) repeat protein
VRPREGLPAVLTVLALVAVTAPLLSACGGSGKKDPASTIPSNAPFSVLIGAGVHQLHQGHTSSANELFTRAVARKPDSPVGYYDLGVALQRAGNVRAALREYRLAVVRDPVYTPALFNEAVLVAPTDPALAIFYYRRILAVRPKSPAVLLNLALAERADHWPRRYVLQTLRRAVELDPSLAHPHAPTSLPPSS